jgi:U6 snRNA-associated Sm-like protein LSm8
MALNAYLNSTPPSPESLFSSLRDPNPRLISNPPLERVTVLTLDGRTMIGTLHSCDGSMNLVLQSAIERIIRPREEEVASEEVPLGLYIVRGDSVAVVGRLDEELDGTIDWTKVHGEVLGGTRHM